MRYLRLGFRSEWADVMERKRCRYGVGWHVYISVERAIDTVTAGNSAYATDKYG